MIRGLLLASLCGVGCRSAGTGPAAPVGPPAELRFSSNSPRGGVRAFSWVDGGVEMTWHARVGKGSLHRRFVPSDEEWNGLWRALDAQEAWASPPTQLEDGPRVAVHLVVGGRVVDHASQGPSRTGAVVGQALFDMLARADGGVPVGPEEPEAVGEGY